MNFTLNTIDGQSPRPSDARAPVTRVAELQDTLNRRVYHPLALRLARRLAVTPKMVSVAGGLTVVMAAAAYAQQIWPWSALVGLALHMGWHVVDGADGDLARMTGRSSPTGELVDGLSDYLSHIILYIVLGFLQTQAGPWGWALLFAAGFSRIVQANHYEVQRRQYQWWVHGIPWLRASRPGSAAGAGVLSALGALYLGLAERLSPQARTVDALVAGAEGDPMRATAVRATIRRECADAVTALTPLSANYRTLVLGVSMIAGSPIYYLLFEALVLNLVLAASIRRCNAAIGRVVADLAQPAASNPR